MGDHHFHFQVTKVCVLHCLVLRVFLLFVIVLLPDVFQQGVRPGTSLRVDLQYVVFVYCCLSVALLLPCGGAQAASSPLAGQTWKRSTSLRILVSVILLLGRIPTVLKIAVTLFPMVSGVKAKPLSLTNKWSFILVGELRPDVFHKDGHPPVQRLVRDNFLPDLGGALSCVGLQATSTSWSKYRTSAFSKDLGLDAFGRRHVVSRKSQLFEKSLFEILSASMPNLKIFNSLLASFKVSKDFISFGVI